MIWADAREVLDRLRQARRRTGKSILGQIGEIARLRMSRHSIQVMEYFDLGLFDDRQSWESKREYVSYWAKDRVYRIQDPQWLASGYDKLLTYALLEGLGLPYPRVRAICHASRFHRGARTLSSVADIEAYLRDPRSYPFFAKPAVSYLGYGNTIMQRYDADRDEIALGNQKRTSVAGFAALCMRHAKGGMIFQDLIAPHPDIARVTGDRVVTMRLMILNGDEGPEIYRAALRIPVGSNMVDNFRRGSSGNMFAEVDLADGSIRRVVSDIGLHYTTVDRHPDTGCVFEGLKLPNWHEALQAAQRASAAMPGLRIHSWDIAFGAGGPLLLETNPRGDFHLLQHAHRRGLAEPRFLKLFAADGGRI